MSRILVLCAAILALGACTIVNSNVTGSSAIPADLSPRTVFIQPGAETDPADPRWPVFAGKLAGALAEKDFAFVTERSAARLTARLGYRIGPGEKVTERVEVPEYGTIGFDRVTGKDGKTRRVPIRGLIGYRIEYRTRILYAREVTLEMTDTTTGKQVFTGRATSRDQCGDLAPVIGPMIASILKDFPRARNGLVVRADKQVCAW
ncbi:hypothetical protein KM176_03475 [Pseudooceanicola sp. CBS1P-1]|uniref:DUF4136 domain-containing protein n=1 Tax=Pseudooceanicola albus TaxID=2692189 RepID=A0A6L7GBI2_9RHOB|nr:MULTISPECIES: hypothetical protein [Pseudooceanicola]MBT9382913.1 hypothetical protein [Pseudooceanicola endophyticus]MXN20163.1 hypothetical protein [Pseudooceanicola albus]